MSDRGDFTLGERVAQRAQVCALSTAWRPCEHDHAPCSPEGITDECPMKCFVGNLVTRGDNEVLRQRCRRRRPQDGADLLQRDPTVRRWEILTRCPVQRIILESSNPLKSAVLTKSCVDLLLQRVETLIAVTNLQLAEERLAVLLPPSSAMTSERLGSGILGKEILPSSRHASISASGRRLVVNESTPVCAGSSALKASNHLRSIDLDRAVLPVSRASNSSRGYGCLGLV